LLTSFFLEREKREREDKEMPATAAAGWGK
jgi:hypothetical protein